MDRSNPSPLTAQPSPTRRHPLTPRPTRAPRALAAAALTLAAACASASFESQGDELMRQTQFADAVVYYEKAIAEGHPSEALELKHREARYAAEMKRGQREHFEGKLVPANTTFRALAAQLPDNAAVQAWLKKSERDLSRKLTQMGKEHLTLREYDAAIQYLKKAIDLDATNEDAATALERAATILEWRAEKGEALWREGLRSWNEGSPLQAEAQIQSSLDYTPDRPEAQDVLADVKTQIAELRQRLATNLEEKGQIYSAREQYKRVRGLGMGGNELDAAIERTDKEVKADEKVRAAEIALAKFDFAKARKLLEEAKGLTMNPENLSAIDARLFQVGEKQNDIEFQRAILSEFEGKFDLAIERLTALDQRTPGYRDVRERLDRIRRQMADSKAAYEEGVKLLGDGKLDDARSKFKAAIFLHPLYRDARDKLKETEAAIKARDRKPATPTQPSEEGAKPAGEATKPAGEETKPAGEETKPATAPADVKPPR
jgi:tetratricopeptide (TPR) repeat protein